MPDENAKDPRDEKFQPRDAKPAPERRSRRGRTFSTEDTDNPLICRGID